MAKATDFDSLNRSLEMKSLLVIGLLHYYYKITNFNSAFEH